MMTFKRPRRRGGGVKRRTGLAAGVLAALFAVPVAGLGQIIENSAGPAAKDAGRVLELAEVWRITDKDEPYFLQYPSRLQVAADGSIFLLDMPERRAQEFLRFSSDGKFIGNIVRIGQSPGELGKGSFPDYVVRGYDLFILDQDTNRCWRAGLDGHFQEEFKAPPSDFPGFIGVLREGLLFWRIGFPPLRELTEGKFIDLPRTLVFVPWEAGKERDIAKVMARTFVSPRYALPDPVTQTLSPDGKSLYFALAGEYLIQEMDLASGSVVRQFRRPYARVPVPPRKPRRPLSEEAQKRLDEDRRRGYTRPTPEYFPDIGSPGLYFVGDRLWVMTSTNDPAKGWLVDVFDREGRFADSFYLGQSRALIGVAEGAVFLSESGADGKVAVVKYRIVK
jgi:hypothetical protein